MNAPNIRFVPRALAVAAIATLMLPAAFAADKRTIDQHQAADPQGQVEINEVSGHIDVVGWDKPEVAVTGVIGDDVDRVDITPVGNRVTVRVVSKKTIGLRFGWSDSAETRLVVHVPKASAISTTLVSADVSVRGVDGSQEIQTVSGDVDSVAVRDARVRTVSGDVHLAAGASKALEIGTVSGDLKVTGNAGGEVTISTVSGDATLVLGTASHLRLKTVSGDFRITTGLASDGSLDAESVSGDFIVEFTGAAPPADYDVETFSGDVTTCFGRKPTHEGYGPGSRLSFRDGAGTARVRIDTKSGDVSLCTRH
jgi:DUF4097 and DUF4098 domain-containing protein YvlB